MNIRKAILQILTGIDNETYDVVRVVMFMSSVVSCGLSIYMAVVHGMWSAETFGLGIATILGGGGAGIAMKAKTEPPLCRMPDDEK